MSTGQDRWSSRLAEELSPVVLQHLRRVRWAVRATLFLGVAASVVANVLHALDNPISQAIAAWPPLALLLTVELISRVPVHRRLLAAARLLATATIAGIAAWVSYWHMAGVAARYGETGASPYLLPLSVDGLIVVASICLVELGGRISTLEAARTAAAEAPPAVPAQIPAVPAQIPAVPAQTPAVPAQIPAVPAQTPAVPAQIPAWAPAVAAPSPAAAAPAHIPAAAAPTHVPAAPAQVPAAAVPARAAAAQVPAAVPAQARAAAARVPATTSAQTRAAAVVPAALAEVAAALPRSNGTNMDSSAFAPAATRQAGQARSAGIPGRAVPPQRDNLLAAASARVNRPSAHNAPSTRSGLSSRNGASSRTGQKETAAKARRSPAETVALANSIKAERPSLTDNEIAAELGISTSRLRTVRREAAATDHTLAA
jgi:hypothetical protein